MFKSFDSMEEMLEFMAEAEDAANQMLLDEQRGISYGDYWCRPVPEQGIFVFGRVMTEEEAYDGEDKESIAMLRDSYSRGYRFGTAYSILGPDGELGSTHVANMWPITEEDFNNMAANRWMPTSRFVERIFSEANDAARAQGKMTSTREPVQMEVVKEDGS